MNIDLGPQRIVLIPTEGQPIGPADVAPFYRAMDNLLAYANKVLGACDEECPTLCGEDRAAGEAGALVSERLWLNRWVVDDYVRENPHQVSDAELEIVAPWRHAYRGAFIVARAVPDHMLLLDQARAFCAQCVGVPSDVAVQTLPCIAALTLLPYKGCVVTDSKYLRLNDDLTPTDVAELRLAARELTDLGVIASAGELIEYSSRLPEGDRMPALWRKTVAETYAALAEGR